MKIYTVRDSVAEYFMPLFTAKNDREAQRMFISGMGDNNPHKADYILFRVGNFDDENGTIQPEETPALVLAGLSIQTEETEQ